MSHVAQVIAGLDRIAGAEQQVMLLARGLKRRGWRVSVVALSGSGGSAALELQRDGVEFTSLEMRKGLADPRGWLRYRRWLGAASPDIVHAHLPHAVLLTRLSRLASPAGRHVDTLHTSAAGGVGRRLAYRATDFLAHRVTAVGQAAAQAQLAAGAVSRRKLEVIPNGIEPERWRPDAQLRAAARRELGLAGEFLWLAAGRLEPVKDYPTLLRAFAAVPPPARLVIAGSGEQQPQLTALSERLGLSRRVRFLGFARDLERWMQAADAFVLSSLWEGLPTALMEASAAARPAVATDVPGVRDALGVRDAADPAIGKRLVAPGNPAALARAMTALMRASVETRQAIGARVRKFANEQFSLESVLDRWENLYQALLQGSSMPARFQPTPQPDAPASCRPSTLKRS